MKTRITSNSRPLLRAFYAFLIGIAVLGAMPRNASAQLYVTHTIVADVFVSIYDATTGEVIKPGFLVALGDEPVAIAVSGNTLFVANRDRGTVAKYDAHTGDEINPSFITGLNQPSGLAVQDNTLFVENRGNGTVGKYDADTGAVINANFIAGLSDLHGLAVKDAK